MNEKKPKKRIKVHVLMAILIVLSFLFGYEIADKKDVLSYDLFKWSKGGIDVVPKPGASPKDRISEDQIFVLRDKIELDIKNAEWSSYEPTGSMEPFLTHTANGLYLKPKGPEDIVIGDIVAYTLDGHDQDIVHRVIDIQKDEHGNIFFVTQGDANPVADPDTVPYSAIKRVLIGVIY